VAYDTIERCRAADVMSKISGKWKAAIIVNLAERPLQFGALQRSLPGLSHKVLSQSLKDLIATRIITRTVRSPAPLLKVEYSLTSMGRELCEPLHALDLWARAHGVAGPNPDQSGVER